MTAFEHENTIYGAYGEFEPVPDDYDWAAHEAEADAWFAQYDDDPNPYHGDYSEM